MMCPGLTSPGGSLPPASLALEKGTPVAIFAEGKQAPVGMGTLEMGTEEIKKVKCVRLESFSRIFLRLLGCVPGATVDRRWLKAGPEAFCGRTRGEVTQSRTTETDRSATPRALLPRPFCAARASASSSLTTSVTIFGRLKRFSTLLAIVHPAASSLLSICLYQRCRAADSSPRAKEMPHVSVFDTVFLA